jgi:hypothetical protein
VNRRQFGGLAAGAMIAGVPLLGGCSTGSSAAGAGRSGNWPGVRRYVVSTGRDGKSFTQFSGYVPADRQSGGSAGPGVLWVTDTMPVDNASPATATGAASSGTGPFKTMPGRDGTVFSYIYSANGDTLTPPLPAHLPSGFPAGGTRGFSGMHRTNSLDYWVILDGEITLATDTDKIHLRPGDTLVIRGASHTWVKASSKPYLAVTVSADAQPLPG